MSQTPEFESWVRSQISSFDKLDLCMRLGGLMLDRRNVHLLASLELLQGVICSSSHVEASPKMSPSRFRRLIERSEQLQLSTIAGADPQENVFSRLVHGAGSVIRSIVGASTDIPDTVQLVLSAMNVLTNDHETGELERRYRSLLRFFEQISQPSHGLLEYGSLSEPPDHPARLIKFVENRDLHRRANMLSFSEEDLKSVVAPEDRDYCLEALVQRIGESPRNVEGTLPGGLVDADGAEMPSPLSGQFQEPSGALITRPVMRDGSTFVLALPAAILPSLLHAICSLAQEYDVIERLVELMTTDLHSLINSAMNGMGCFEFDPASTPNLKLGEAEFLYGTDANKLIYVSVLLDELKDLGDTFGEKWDVTDRVNEQVQRNVEIDEVIRAEFGPRFDLLKVMVTQDMGRISPFTWPGEEASGVPDLVIPSVDFQIICDAEKGNPLGLHQFTHQLHLLYQNSQVISWSVLDLYSIYDKNGRSFYLGDETRYPAFLQLAPGTALDLRMEYEDSNGLKLVDDQHGKPMLCRYAFAPDNPFFTPIDQELDRMRLAVKLGESTVWIESGVEVSRALIDQQYALVDALSYWLWQFWILAPACRDAIEGMRVINLILEDGRWDLNSRRDSNPNGDVINVEVEEDGLVEISVFDSIQDLISHADNDADRAIAEALIKAVVHGQAENGDVTEEELIRSLVDAVAPLGNKRKLNAFSLDAEPSWDPTDLPPFRQIQKSDMSIVSDIVAVQLEHRGISSVGSSVNDRTDVLGVVVEIAFHELISFVTQFRRNPLLEFLICNSEASTREFRVAGITAPQEIACYGQTADVVQRLSDRNFEANASSIAVRFLIELAGSLESSGTLMPTLDTYDHMMALSSQVLNAGSASDSIRYGLIDTNVEILGSGRIAYVDRSFQRARREFGNAWATDFVTNPRIPTVRVPNPEINSTQDQSDRVLQELDAAMKEEFGATLTEYSALIAKIFDFGIDQRGCLKTATEEEMVSLIESTIDGVNPREMINNILIERRPEFMNPSSGRPSDVYPWKFNREHSYIRRPLVSLGNLGDDSTQRYGWGNRHLFESVRYLVSLIDDGRYKAKSRTVQKLMGKHVEQFGRRFEHGVAESIESDPEVLIRESVKKIGSKRIANDRGDLGDIDVLVADKRTKTIFLLECKSFAMARTPSEISTDVEELIKDENSTAVKHLRRSKWVRANIDRVLDWLQIQSQPTEWQITPAIVLDGIQMTVYLSTSPIPIILISELEKTPLGQLGSLLNSRLSVGSEQSGATNSDGN